MKSRKITIILRFAYRWTAAATLAFALSSALPVAHSREPAPSHLQATIEQAREGVLARRQDGTYWNLPSYLGSHYLSQYFLVLKFLNRAGRGETRLDPEKLKSVLLATQLPDGSWQTVKDANRTTGDLNATIFNYWALKAMGVPLHTGALPKTSEWIRAHGGLESGSLFTKIFLALFGVGSWKEIPEIPYLLFNDASPVKSDDFAQWVSPHLLPIAYLRKMEVTWHDPELSDLRELHSRFCPSIQPHAPKSAGGAEEKLITKLLSIQQPRGSFGAYTSATLFSILAFDHFQKHSNASASEIDTAKARGFRFIEWMMLESGESAYKGVVDDGRYWDTALLGIAALESGTPARNLIPTAEYLVREAQTSGGGFAFGEDFAFAPDTDDTAEILLLFSRLPRTPELEASATRAVKWLLRMQNSDGGWGAFARNNNGNFVLDYFASAFKDSADLFDESTVDVTGHIIEALAANGANIHNSQAVRRAVKFILTNQEKTGSWMGRWGVNHVYGTSAAVIGLVAAGVSPASPEISRAITWLRSVQNRDGGFGEATSSYVDRNAWGKGISTPTQTAWALQALVAARVGKSEAATRAADFLLRTFDPKKLWSDPSTVGTGHPVIVYMDYPSYPLAFPLVALSRYQQAIDLP